MAPSADRCMGDPGWSSEDQDICSDAVHNLQARCSDGNELLSPWTDWVENGIEFFGCKGERKGGQGVICGRAIALQHSTDFDEDEHDFARMHDEFFESLLKEKLVKRGLRRTHSELPPLHPTKPSSLRRTHSALPTLHTSTHTDVPPVSPCESQDESINSSVSSSSSMTYSSVSLNSTKPRMRQRPLRLHKQTHHQRHSRVAPIEAYNRMFNPDFANQVLFDEIIYKDLPDADSYLHEECTLQKDKGRGEPLGTSISAEGRDQCLRKLREKITIVTQVAGEPSGMKRRRAKVSETTPGYIETRSLIELRLGFLSMQYGLLLRWDYRDTGKIVFVLLRKMCHDSFLTKASPLFNDSSSALASRKQIEAPPLVVRNGNGNNAIYQRMSGTEVMLVGPPYRVTQPEDFEPSVLSVEINQIEGLSPKSKWTISITFDGHTETAQLHYCSESQRFEARRDDPMRWEMMHVSSFDPAGLEIRLFQQNKQKNVRSRLASTTTVPLGGLVAQPSTSKSTSWQVTMPFSHPAKSEITLSLVHESDYAHWLYKELGARRSEVIGPSWKAPFPRRARKKAKTYEETQDYFNWFCGICFKELCVF